MSFVSATKKVPSVNLSMNAEELAARFFKWKGNSIVWERSSLLATSLEFLSSIDIRRSLLLSACAVVFLLSISTLNLSRYQLSSFIPTVLRPANSTTGSSKKIPATAALTKLIVVSHFNEDLDWLDLFLGEQIPHIVYTRSSDSLARHNIAVNKGREAVAYLRYIVDHYSNLPSVIAFVHGHRTAWHQRDPSDIVVALRALRWSKYPYMPLTSTATSSRFQLNSPDPQFRVNFELWRDVLQKELGPPPAEGIRAQCCASFAVKREAILAHPKLFYSKILDYIVASPHSDQLTGRTLEYTWHMIFGQPAHMSFRMCDIFFCDSNGMISVSLAERTA